MISGESNIERALHPLVTILLIMFKISSFRAYDTQLDGLRWSLRRPAERRSRQMNYSILVVRRADFIAAWPLALSPHLSLEGNPPANLHYLNCYGNFQMGRSPGHHPRLLLPYIYWPLETGGLNYLVKALNWVVQPYDNNPLDKTPDPWPLTFLYVVESASTNLGAVGRWLFTG